MTHGAEEEKDSAGDGDRTNHQHADHEDNVVALRYERAEHVKDAGGYHVGE